MKLKRHSRPDGGFKAVALILLCLTFVSAVADNVLAAERSTKTVDGLTATLSVTPGMVDLLLVDAGSGTAVTDGEVIATVVRPDGQKRVKALMGMKMGKVYSYMNSLDMSTKGIYTFHITVKAGEKSVNFDFKSGAV